MKKKIDKSNIVTFGGVALLTVATIGFIAVDSFDRKFNHLNEYCPLNDVLGIEHQIEVINDRYGNTINATYHESEKEEIKTNVSVITGEDGEVYVVPVGYELEDGKAVKTINESNDMIIITKGIPVLEDGVERGETVEESDVELLYPRVVNTIEVPKRTK